MTCSLYAVDICTVNLVMPLGRFEDCGGESSSKAEVAGISGGIWMTASPSMYETFPEYIRVDRAASGVVVEEKEDCGEG